MGRHTLGKALRKFGVMASPQARSAMPLAWVSDGGACPVHRKRMAGKGFAEVEEEKAASTALQRKGRLSQAAFGGHGANPLPAVRV